ncbi:hypothetical protein BGZ80_005959 [Entomortierella chlamydospora]|uniref:Uncharacterized protein n=1 Tax=Entomortierella chlamydospora TaxID=101097 RepID=A0A9P6SU94_9FUNG|nr:hypothetical protein BGZ80_005959 [Entomortierella chlamydospora]
MLARKGITAATAVSARYALRSGARHHQDQSAALSFRISRLFSSSKAALQTSEPARVPRPIPLDIGNPGSPAALSSASTVAGAGSARRRFRGYSSGSLFDRYGEPIINITVYTTAVSLVLHLIYNQLSLEEYRISSSQKIAELEAEIAAIKGQASSPSSSSSVQHSLGGRGEFI